MSALLLLAAGDDREHGGNDGYADDPDSTYRWDSTVAHHAEVAVGDKIVLWDKRTSLGVSVIEDCTVSSMVKTLSKCPHCGRAGIKRRRSKVPAYKCFKCQGLFDQPTLVTKLVTTYETSHASGWIDLRDMLSGAQLRELCLHPRSQQSLRPLVWQKFEAAVEHSGTPVMLNAVNSSERRVVGGHTDATVRVRVGQATFRSRVLEEFGAICALSGPALLVALEAGHLYSYAAAGRHHSGGS
ncbi:zf-TFIIB domain-containing protein [Segeticoccus rhizosphaerae]|uniref:zf-TFIIB domain-containing protein n=1 Tax=Segeticoccus rhizosphaerae TaxID=1104777 RepID=UPI001396A9FE|nr:zf-TFIIB domain-containing protein [Segeticoccus rhizosphaerae]